MERNYAEDRTSYVFSRDVVLQVSTAFIFLYGMHRRRI